MSKVLVPVAPGFEEIEAVTIIDVLRAKNRRLAAICTAPTVLAACGVLHDRAATSHPTVRAEMAAATARVSDERVIVDGPVVTSRAAGTAMEFAFKLVELLCGSEKVAEVNRSVLAKL